MAKDPYKYFRIEARELLDGLTRPLVEIEKGVPSDAELVAQMLRLAHTLKGAAHVVKQGAIADAAHRIEDLLSPYRDAATKVSSETAGAALRLLAEIAARISELAPPPDDRPGGAVATAHSAQSLETVRVELEDVEALLACLQEAGVQMTSLRSETDSLRHARDLAAALVRQLASPELTNGGARIGAVAAQLLSSLAACQRALYTGVERTERELQQSQERANRLRLIPFERIVPSLARACHETATALGKRVEVEVGGVDVRMETDALAILQDALVQLVRNAVAHGIEDEGTRRACGKPVAGRIELRAERMGGRIRVLCRDDGGGIDVDAIRKAAVRKGSISADKAQSLDLRKAIDLILGGGVSTAEEITQTSGRGIGLDIVRDAVERVKGEIAIQTTRGLGTSVEICVPAVLTALDALLVESAGTRACIPLASVSQGLGLAVGDIASSGCQSSIATADGPVPFLPLSELLGKAHNQADGKERRTAVLLRAENKMAALGIERLLGTRSVLVRTLSPLAAAEAFVGGASVDADGSPILVLDPAALIEQMIQHSNSQPRAKKQEFPLLIVDDSLTTRMVEQNILESAGYEVDSATSAEEALEMAHRRTYSLFLVDIEMPGMDGFQFVEKSREDSALRDVPSILVSSRNSPEDRRRGEEAGARAYFCKGEFDQAGFLATVARLTE